MHKASTQTVKKKCDSCQGAMMPLTENLKDTNLVADKFRQVRYLCRNQKFLIHLNI